MYPQIHLAPKLGYALFARLCRSLPAPEDDTQLARDDRDAIAMTALAELDPCDTVEALLAVQAITTEAHATACLESAGRRATDDPVGVR